MKVRISKFKANGTVSVPSSKSVIHRELIMAFLSTNEVTISDITFSNDVNATLGALENMGANTVVSSNEVTFKKPNRKVREAVIYCNESGSTLRFLIPVASYLIKHVKFIGKESLFRRPLGIYEEILIDEKIEFKKTERSFEIFDSMYPKDFIVRGDVSSQFISGLLMMYAASNERYKLEVIEPYESREYVDITVDCMNKFGFPALSQGNTYITAKGDGISPKIHYAEKDYSQAAFFLCLGALNGKIKLTGMNPSSLQGDKGIIDFLKRMGADIKVNGADISVKESNLKPTLIDLKSMIDSGPILFVLSSLIEGDTHITNIRRLRIKESDRVMAMKEELEKCGVKMDVSENDCIIHGKKGYKGDFELYGHNDHRIVMALSVFASLNDGVISIDGAEAINKSYVSFFDDLRKVGGKIDA